VEVEARTSQFNSKKDSEFIVCMQRALVAAQNKIKQYKIE